MACIIILQDSILRVGIPGILWLMYHKYKSTCFSPHRPLSRRSGSRSDTSSSTDAASSVPSTAARCRRCSHSSSTVSGSWLSSFRGRSSSTNNSFTCCTTTSSRASSERSSGTVRRTASISGLCLRLGSCCLIITIVIVLIKNYLLQDKPNEVYNLSSQWSLV